MPIETKNLFFEFSLTTQFLLKIMIAAEIVQQFDLAGGGWV